MECLAGLDGQLEQVGESFGGEVIALLHAGLKAVTGCFVLLWGEQGCADIVRAVDDEDWVVGVGDAIDHLLQVLDKAGRVAFACEGEDTEQMMGSKPDHGDRAGLGKIWDAGAAVLLDEGYGSGGEHRFDESADEEGEDAEREGAAPAKDGGQPEGSEGEIDGVAAEHNGKGGEQAGARPAALCQPADEGRDDGKAYEVARCGSKEREDSAGAVGKDWKAQQGLPEPRTYGDSAQDWSEERADDDDDIRLHGDGDGQGGEAEPGRGGQGEGAERDLS